MFQDNPEIALAIIYKILHLTFAGFLLFLAYKLFEKSEQIKTGNINASWGKLSLTLKNNPSGTLFLFAGLLIILLSIFRGINFTEKKTVNTQPKSQQISFANDSLPDLSTIQHLNIDSLFDLSKKSALKEKYLEALKYLYTIQGYCIQRECDTTILKLTNADIKIYENHLSNLLKNAFDKSNQIKLNEERSTKISDTSQSEIR